MKTEADDQERKDREGVAVRPSNEGVAVSLSSGQTPLRTLLRESLDTAVEYSQKLTAGTESLAERFENGETAEALPVLSQIFDGLGWLIGVYDRCRTFMPVPVRADEETMMKGKILETLRLLVRLADEGNFAAMAQALRWELLPSIQTLSQRVKELSGLRIGLQ